MPSFLPEFETSDVHLGIAGVAIDETVDLGGGIRLKPSYAHLFAPFMLAFNRPAEEGAHHAGPWEAAKGGFNFDISGELHVPSSVISSHGPTIQVAKTILALLRIWANPAVVSPVVASGPISHEGSGADGEVRFYPMEVMPRWFSLTSSSTVLNHENLDWVKNKWPVAHGLTKTSSEFAFALETISQGQFIENPAMTLVSLWAALEALFSPSTSELKFRVSALIASFLEAPGDQRAEKQKIIGKLYDKRSSAAHGKPKHGSSDLLQTFMLLRDVLIAIIDQGAVPTSDELNALLFGSK